MNSFVVDASVALAWCFADEASPETEALLERATKQAAVAPTILVYELANILSRAITAGRIGAEAAAARLEHLSTLVTVDNSVDSTGVLLRAASDHGLTAYDAAYLALASSLGLPLATLDQKLRQAAENANVTVVPDADGPG